MVTALNSPAEGFFIAYNILKISGVAVIGATIAWKGRAIEKLLTHLRLNIAC
jgi:hypothetical protein